MKPHRLLGALVLSGTMIVGALVADGAGVSPAVCRAFRGEILVTAKPLGTPHPNSKKAIAEWRKLQVQEIKHEVVQGVPTWYWHYAAFLRRKPPATSLTFEFYTDDKEALFKADKKIGLSAATMVIQGTMSITEDDNITKGQRYVLKLVGDVRGKEVIYAKTRITLK
jgi:hypothetical protein